MKQKIKRVWSLGQGGKSVEQKNGGTPAICNNCVSGALERMA